MCTLLAIFAISILPGPLDTSTPDFPGIMRCDTGFLSAQPTPELHPHLRLNETMTSVPKVYPGDMVFWHCVTSFICCVPSVLTAS